MYGYGRRKKAESHEKSMGSYEMFAWQDAISIAVLIEEEFDIADVHAAYLKIAPSVVADFEERNRQLIGDFIQKSESQRLPFLRRINKEGNDASKILFLVLAVIGVLRAKQVMELRDSFRTVLAPGRGNRITTAAVYDFSHAIRAIYSYSWPTEVFEALGFYADDDS